MNERDREILAKRFQARLLSAVEQCIDECHYTPSYYIRMIADYGPLETARQLITVDRLHEGFTHLWERNRLDLTIESIVLEEEFRPLFTQDLIDAARRRLNEFQILPN